MRNAQSYQTLKPSSTNRSPVRAEHFQDPNQETAKEPRNMAQPGMPATPARVEPGMQQMMNPPQGHAGAQMTNPAQGHVGPTGEYPATSMATHGQYPAPGPYQYPLPTTLQGWKEAAHCQVQVV